VSTVAHDPSEFSAPSNAIVERFIPHQPVIDKATVVVCHGGMGIVQKSLSAGVPMCVVPGGRDQFAVAERVVAINAGTSLMPFGLDVAELRSAILHAMTLTDGAKRAAEGFARTGGAVAAADALEGLVGAVAR
jgi:UDP:flavonoid glycosyltransferase YjiC (YdhE family)